MKQLATYLLFSAFYTSSLAQGGQITSLYVEPQNPTVGDEVTVYADLVFPSSGCPLDYVAFALQNTTFTASAHHCVGLLTAICNTRDTFELGQLAAGIYTFDLTLTSGAGGSGCSPGFVPDDNDQLQFVVSPSVRIDELETRKDHIYPNPFSDQLNFRSPLVETAAIIDINGKTVKEIDAGSTQIDLKGLPKGVYLFRTGLRVYKLAKE